MKRKTKLDTFDAVFDVAMRKSHLPGQDVGLKADAEFLRKHKPNPLHNSVVVKCNADGSYLSEFEPNGRAIFRFKKSERMILRADDARLEPYFDAPYEVRDITVTPD